MIHSDRSHQRRGFQIHALVFALTSVALVVINVWTGPPYWVGWSLPGWAIGLLAHGWCVGAFGTRRSGAA